MQVLMSFEGKTNSPEDKIGGKPQAMEKLKDTYRFNLVRLIAAGGMGTVYEAIQQGAEGFEKRVAIKMITEEFSDEHQLVEMFIGEAKLVADLVHPNIVQIYQLGKVGKSYYIAMEFINGKNLGQFRRRHSQLEQSVPVELSTFIVSRVCRGLEYAHSKCDADDQPLGVVHRDVNPKNIMLDSEGAVKLTDFGIAKARHLLRLEGTVLMGTTRYMSPEQARFEETDARSDLFSLGIVLHELLTGRPLFDARDQMAAFEAIIHQPIPRPSELNPDVPEEVDRITIKALERDRERRYQTASEMAHDLEYYMYNDRYGPTSTTLAKYLHEIFPELACPSLAPLLDTTWQVDPYTETIVKRGAKQGEKSY
jgi:serine/threonine protein kinase